MLQTRFVCLDCHNYLMKKNKNNGLLHYLLVKILWSTRKSSGFVRDIGQLMLPWKHVQGVTNAHLILPAFLMSPHHVFQLPNHNLVQLKTKTRTWIFFFQKDKITDFKRFNPDKQLIKICKEKGKNLIITRPTDKFVCLFMSSDFSECEGSIVVHNKSTLCSPLIVEAFQKGIRVSTLSQILHPNNGLSTYSQFFEVVYRVENFVPTAKSTGWFFLRAIN